MQPAGFLLQFQDLAAFLTEVLFANGQNGFWCQSTYPARNDAAVGQRFLDLKVQRGLEPQARLMLLCTLDTSLAQIPQLHMRQPTGPIACPSLPVPRCLDHRNSVQEPAPSLLPWSTTHPHG